MQPGSPHSDSPVMRLFLRRCRMPPLIGALVVGSVRGDMRAQTIPDWHHAVSSGFVAERFVGLLDLQKALSESLTRAIGPAVLC